MRLFIPLSLAAWLFVFSAAAWVIADDDPRPVLQVDADFPGGNILVKKIEGDTIEIAQDLRDTSGWWFYYNFRVRGAAGRELTFRWTNQNPMVTLGPAVSTDGGQNWAWLGKMADQEDAVQGDSFRYRFAGDDQEVRFCLAMPYQQADLDRFIARHRKNPAFRKELHATTRKDREVYRLHVGQLGAEPKYRVFLTARHHSCEMMANFTLEGLLETILGNSPEGKWLRENVEFVAVPLMDLDGVEDGDQGKNRRPHDHNRDYDGEGTPLYASVAANKEFVPQWSGGKLRILLDLHCPWVRGGGNEEIFFVGGPDQEIWKNATELAILLEAAQSGPLPYKVENNLPHGESWNTDASNLQRSFSRWGSKQPGVAISNTIEIPYAVAGGQPVTRQSAQALGHDLAVALRRYLMTLEE